MAEAEQPSTAAVGGLSTSLLDSINARRIATPAKDDKPEEAAKPSPRGSSSKTKKKTKGSLRQRTQTSSRPPRVMRPSRSQLCRLTSSA